MINLELTQDEALVLSALLCRTSRMEETIVFEDKSERHVLWSLECQLEKKLLEPCVPNYNQVLEKSRDCVRMKDD